jgi:hypothetical protein
VKIAGFNLILNLEWQECVFAKEAASGNADSSPSTKMASSEQWRFKKCSITGMDLGHELGFDVVST